MTNITDRPGFALEGTGGSPPRSIVYEFAEYDGTWTAFLIFKPTGTDSEWVPIKKLIWSWHGTATLNSGSSPRTWTTANITLPGTANPAGEDTMEYPTWVRVFASPQPC